MSKSTRTILIPLLGLIIFFGGCEEAGDSISFGSIDQSRLQGGITHPADDIAGSEITSRQYPETAFVIIAIGDSLTYGIRSEAGGYPAMLQSKLTQAGYDAIVINEGIPGETAPQTHERFLHEIAGADIVLLMIGMNDLLNPGKCPEPFNCDTIGHTKAMVEEALISGITPLVSTVTPSTSNGTFSWVNNWVVAHNSMIYQFVAEKEAEQEEVFLVDNYMAILQNGGSSLYQSDGVHFTDRGYDVLAQQWFDVLVTNGLIEMPQSDLP